MKEKFIIIVIIALISLALLLISGKLKGKEEKEVTKVQMTTVMMMNIVALASISMVVGFIEIPVTLIGAKFDLSEVIILLTYFIIGFKGSMLVVILRSAGRLLLIPPRTAIEGDLIWRLLGEGIAIVASIAIILSYILVKKILSKKEQPLFYEVPSNLEIDNKKEKRKDKIMLWLLPVVTAIILNIVMITFHTIITMPMFLSGNTHFTIFSLLKDPAYSSQTIIGIIKTIIGMFGVLNLVKGIISPLIFLLLKPRLSKILK